MFTGIVLEVGRVRRIGRHGGVTEIEIEAPDTARPSDGPPPTVGDSIAVNGVCLTVVRITGTRLAVEATAETRRITTLADWRAGSPVHVEPSLRAGGPVGGHFVLGHVDGTGRILSVRRRGGTATMTIGVAPLLAGRLLPKGSIAVDGVSLTLDEGPFHDRFTVTLIPHTLAATRFAFVRPHARVNLELDVLAKAAERAVARRPLTLDALRARMGTLHSGVRGDGRP